VDCSIHRLAPREDFTVKQKIPDSNDLVLTEAQQAPPPDVTVPEAHPRTAAATGEIDSVLLMEIRKLSDRVGGLHQLRKIINALIEFER
jgi:hypothetical protein